MSVTVTAPVVGNVPTLDTVRVKLFVVPTTKVPLCVLAIARSIEAGALTGVVTLPVLLVALPSPVVETVAAFSTLGAAAAPTSTVSVMAGSDAPLATGPGVEQLTVPAACEQVHPVPVADTKVSPAGRMSVTEIAPVVADVPTLDTVSVAGVRATVKGRLPPSRA
jgi:hypothetical protein